MEKRLSALTRVVREGTIATIVVEQHARKILTVTDEAIVLDRRRIGAARPYKGIAATVRTSLAP